MNLAIINARMQSKRFPGKLMQELVDGKPVLQVFLERMKTVQSWDGMVLAIQENPENEPLAEVAKSLKVPVFRSNLPLLPSGAEDVLGRTKEVADHYKANAIIRVTPDNPALHRDVIQRACVTYYMNRNACHYVSNCWHRGDQGKGFPRGFEVEVFSYAAIGQVDNETADPAKRIPPASETEPAWKTEQRIYDREHVTTWLRRYPRLLGQADVVPQSGMSGNTESGLVALRESLPVRLTLDYPEDLEVLRNVFKELQHKRSSQYPNAANPEEHGYFTLTDIAELYEGVRGNRNRPDVPGRPELFKANQHIEQWG